MEVHKKRFYIFSGIIAVLFLAAWLYAGIASHNAGLAGGMVAGGIMLPAVALTAMNGLYGIYVVMSLYKVKAPVWGATIIALPFWYVLWMLADSILF